MELLAPAKNFTLAKAVFSCGADAVYFGGKKFGARAYADNFDEIEICELIDHCHIFGKKAYMTVNTLLKDVEMERSLFETIEPLYRQGLDAVLVQDFGVMAFLKKHFPELPLHASTQTNVTSRYGASLLKQAGASRVVLARELSIAEMAAIHAAEDVELEVFVHGALCVCYSGQCLMSSMIGGRSGNRGACGQACRLAYMVTDEKGKKLSPSGDYPLSPKDLCGIKDLPALQKAGVASLKLEGRMKGIDYAATVTEVYRKYLDLLEKEGEEAFFVEEKDIRRLMDAGNRSGFTNAYYYHRNDTKMMAYADSAHHRTVKEEPVIHPLALSVRAFARVQAEQPLLVRFGSKEHSAEAVGERPLEAARTKPTASADICLKLNKTGDYPFVLEDITVSGGDTSFVPMKELNELRRRAMDALLDKMTLPFRRTLPAEGASLDEEGMEAERGVLNEPEAGTWKDAPGRKAARETSDASGRNAAKENSAPQPPALCVRVTTADQLSVCLSQPHVSELIVPDGLWEMAVSLQEQEDCTVSIIFALPTIIRTNNAERIAAFVKDHLDASYEADGYDALGLLLACGVDPGQIRGGMRLYAWSNRTRATFFALGLRRLTVPVELSFKELLHRNNRGDSLRIYGRYPLMLTANCVKKACVGCDRQPTTLVLSDKKGYAFPVINDCNNCTNTIYNSRPLSLFSDAADVKRLRTAALEIDFVTETAKEIKEVFAKYDKAFISDEESGFSFEVTKGHFRRGVKE